MDSSLLMWIVGGLLSVFQVLGLGFCRLLWINFQEVKKQAVDANNALADHKSYCAQKYSTKDELAKAVEDVSKSLDRMSGMLDKIDSKLDNKQDKP